MTTPRISRLVAAFAASSLLLATASADARRGGNEGEGPIIIPSAEPCAALVGPDRLDADRPRSEVRFIFDVHNCSRNASAFTVSLRGVQETGTVPVPCATATRTVTTATVAGAGETEVRMAPPGQRVGGCVLGTGEYFYTATVKDAATGQTLNTLQFRTQHNSL